MSIRIPRLSIHLRCIAVKEINVTRARRPRLAKLWVKNDTQQSGPVGVLDAVSNVEDLTLGRCSVHSLFEFVDKTLVLDHQQFVCRWQRCQVDQVFKVAARFPLHP